MTRRRRHPTRCCSARARTHYRYSLSYLAGLAGQISVKDFYAIHEWFAGHNFWVYQLFAGGIVSGLALPVALLYSLYRCCIAYRRWRALAPNSLYLPVMDARS